MVNLSDILKSVPYKNIVGDSNIAVSDICIDSRLVTHDSMFVAQKGYTTDSHAFIEDVISKGAKTIVCQTLPETLNPNVTYIQLENTTSSLGVLSANFYQHPTHSLKVVGVTGTNGKTTCATLLYQLFTELGYCCGLISTVQNIIGKKISPSTHTTPDALSLQKLMHEMLQHGCEYVFMEVSSHAIHQQRIAGVHFVGACFTNITHDHLDYHSTFEEYINVKKSWFDILPNTAFALTNLDDKRGGVMLQNTNARKKSYSLRTLADYKGKVIENAIDGLLMTINQQEVYFKMIGEFNAYNLLCVYGVAVELGMDKQEVLTKMSSLQGARGRFECIRSAKSNILGIVDYAHTPDALLNVLATINKLRKGNEVLYTIVGCGGDRDKTKRPVMALVTCEHSDKVIFTSDNPRSESPESILADMEAGVPVHQKKKYIVVADRSEAIKLACSQAQESDIILVAGKGHETYQEVNGVKHPFDDKKVLNEMLNLYEK